jgi:hypothetical protein
MLDTPPRDHLTTVSNTREGESLRWKGMKVIGADAHMHEPEYLWERYVEPKHRDRVPKVAFMDGVLFTVYEPDGQIIPKGDLQLRPPPSANNGLDAV